MIDDGLFPRYISSTDFIQQYIFPGGCLPCPREFRREAEAAGLQVGGRVLPLGRTMPKPQTLARALSGAARRDLKLGTTSASCTSGSFCLAYCEAAFAMSNIDLVQYTLVKAECYEKITHHRRAIYYERWLLALFGVQILSNPCTG